MFVIRKWSTAVIDLIRWYCPLMSKLANRWPKKKIREWLRRNLQCPTKSRVLSSMIQFHLNFQSSLSSLPRWHLERFQCRSSAQFPVRLIFFSVSRRNLIPDGPLTGLSRFDNPVLSPGLVNSKGTSSSSHSGLSWSVPISTFSSLTVQKVNLGSIAWSGPTSPTGLLDATSSFFFDIFFSLFFK